jgi:adenine-specific DNA-methyltransferase
VKEEGDIRQGFVYKRVPHITLKSIANNEEIDAIYARWQEKMEPVRAELNRLAGEIWEEWEIPREAPEGARFIVPQREWWDLRLGRQKEIDDSISRHADTELLYDQPYEDKGRVRVTGPFTVESLSPHRMLAPEVERTGTEAASERDPSAQSFERMILEHLKVAGVQNTVKGERLKFDRLEVIANPNLHASGEYTDKSGKPHRVAVFIGPEHGTVGPNHIKAAAMEAVKGLGHEMLVVCGFAFDPHVNEEARRYGKLEVLVTRMNNDLSLGPDVLKKTPAANLFMVFGEPDIQPVDSKTGKILPGKDGKIVIEITGVDVYDPTTRQVRGHTTDDIACWFVDTNYNGESFFVRQAYFTGAGEPYERLRKALRAEINESAWATLYTTKSRPFDKPTTGKIAVKVINHFGDEVLKVYEVG